MHVEDVFAAPGGGIRRIGGRAQLPSFRLALIPADGGKPVKVFPVPFMGFAMAGLRWTTDGLSIVYINNEHNVSNLWSQPIDGKPRKQLTHFESSQIFRFAFSPDGKQVRLERGATLRDVVLITSSHANL